MKTDRTEIDPVQLQQLIPIAGPAGPTCDPLTGECYPTVPAEDGTLVRSLVHAGRLMAGRLDAALASEGLSIAKLSLLKVLVNSDRPLPLNQIADRLSCVKSNITQLVDRLEADGLVERIPDPDDRRSKPAKVTAEGRRLFLAGAQMEVQIETQLLQDFSSDERGQLKAMLERFTTNAQRDRQIMAA